MNALAPQKKANKLFFIAAFIIMLSMAFLQCYQTTHDLRWAPDPDFDRDIAFVRGTLEGNFGKDPNYAGEYIWYNPLLFSVESVIVKVTSLPPNVVAVRAGAYLNLLGPVAFFIMGLSLFGFEVALASLLSFLFFASGNIQSWGAATYSPRLYPVCFTQFLFYVNIVLCFKAFSAQKYFWFILLGASVGISFLGHAAPAIILILIMFSIQSQNIFNSLRQKDYSLLKKYILQGILAFAFFTIAAMPLIYYIVGKYHLHLITRATFEYTEGIFYLSNFKEMVKENLSVSFFISIIGLIWFYKNFRQQLIRKIIFSWLFISIFMYLYSTLVAVLDDKFHIHLPGTVPSFHYFFYLKALQSVFFGVGFIFLVFPVIKWAEDFIHKKKNIYRKKDYANIIFVMAVLICSCVYFPFYKNRGDFAIFREQAIIKENKKDEIGVHDYLLKNVSSDKVILCEKNPSIFPVMATARKMVSIAYTFSNPYLDFDKREEDRNNMLLFLKTGQPVSAKQLFGKYDVSFALISAKELSGYQTIPPMLGQAVFKNDSFTLFSLNK
jgi:hypothetical protein